MTPIIPASYLRRMSPADRARYGKDGLLPEERQQKADYRAEAILQRLIYSWLRQRGYEVGWARTDKRSRYTEGWPDFTFAVQRQAVGIEVKVPGGKLSDEQISTHMAMRKNGWEIRVCWSLEEVIDYVTRLESGSKTPCQPAEKA
jgi:hypothetical protein